MALHQTDDAAGCCLPATGGVAPRAQFRRLNWKSHRAIAAGCADGAGCFRMSKRSHNHRWELSMNVTGLIPIGASAEQVIVVTREMTVAHFVETMPAVYGTPIMIFD